MCDSAPEASSSDSVPISMANWIAFRDSNSSTSCWEYPLFSDADLHGELRDVLGPYVVIALYPIIVARNHVRGIVLMLSC